MFDRRELIKTGLMTAATAAVGGSLLSACGAPGRKALATTIEGPLAGQINGDVFTFKGIRYGRVDPTARFRPATRLQPWSDIKEATAYGPSAPQPPGGPASGRAAAFGADPEVAQSEDCLVLNVWTRGLADGARRPVMVWLHGGGYSSGSGSRSITEGENLARNHDVVVVTLNHRLGPLGFLYLDEIAGADYAGSANLGLLDIVLALEWVRDNIAAFGGDPANVTIFGQSGGAGKVTHLLCMPAARGLFHRAIMESGVSIRSVTPEFGAQMTRDLLEYCDVTGDPIRALQALPVEKLLEAHSKIQTKDGKMWRGCSPVIDGVHLFDHPEAIFAAGKGHDIPIILGTTRDELTATTPLMSRLPTLTEAEFNAEAEEILGEHAAQVLAGYRQLMPQAPLRDLAMQFHMDHKMRMTAARIADALVTGQRSPVFMYRFDWTSPLFPEDGASHSFELPMIFDNVSKAPLTSGDAAAVMLGTQMSTAWTSFARSGRPTLPAATWPEYTAESRATLLFKDPIESVIDPLADNRRIWRDVPSTRLGFD